MKCQFIEQHQHEFPIMVMCTVLGVSESGLYAWCSVLQALAHEKMLSSLKRFGRFTPPIEADMAVRVFITSSKTRGEARLSLRVARLMREAALSARRK